MFKNMSSVSKRKRSAPQAVKTSVAKSRRVSDSNSYSGFAADIVEDRHSDSSNDVRHTQQALDNTAVGISNPEPKDEPKSRRRGKSPIGKAVLNTRDLSVSPRGDDEHVYISVKSKSKKLSDVSIPKEHRSEELISSVNVLKYVSPVDTLQFGVWSQWLKAFQCIFSTITPLFGFLSVVFYTAGGKDHVQVAIAFLLVNFAVMVLTVVFGFPLVLVHRALNF